MYFLQPGPMNRLRQLQRASLARRLLSGTTRLRVMEASICRALRFIPALCRAWQYSRQRLRPIRRTFTRCDSFTTAGRSARPQIKFRPESSLTSPSLQILLRRLEGFYEKGELRFLSPGLCFLGQEFVNMTLSRIDPSSWRRISSLLDHYRAPGNAYAGTDYSRLDRVRLVNNQPVRSDLSSLLL